MTFHSSSVELQQNGHPDSVYPFQEGDTTTWINEFLSQNKGVYRFSFSFYPLFPYFFAYSTLLFIKLHLRDFSPCWLQPRLDFACFLLKAGMEAFGHLLDFQVIFVAISHGPFLITSFRVFLYNTNQQNNTRVSLSYQSR